MKGQGKTEYGHESGYGCDREHQPLSGGARVTKERIRRFACVDRFEQMTSRRENTDCPNHCTDNQQYVYALYDEWPVSVCVRRVRAVERHGFLFCAFCGPGLSSAPSAALVSLLRLLRHGRGTPVSHG